MSESPRPPVIIERAPDGLWRYVGEMEWRSGYRDGIENELLHGETLPASWTPNNLASALEAARVHLETLGCFHIYERGECVSCVLRAELRRLGIDVPSKERKAFGGHGE